MPNLFSLLNTKLSYILSFMRFRMSVWKFTLIFPFSQEDAFGVEVLGFYEVMSDWLGLHNQFCQDQRRRCLKFFFLQFIYFDRSFLVLAWSMTWFTSFLKLSEQLSNRKCAAFTLFWNYIILQAAIFYLLPWLAKSVSFIFKCECNIDTKIQNLRLKTLSKGMNHSFSILSTH